MTVLAILGVVIMIAFVYVFIVKVNGYTDKTYTYEFFNMVNFSMIGIGYTLIFFGNRWYQSALKENADLLNGQLLIAFGIVLILIAFVYNMKKTSLSLGLGLTLIQCIIYLPLAMASFLAVVAALSYLFNTRPVYTLNK